MIAKNIEGIYAAGSAGVKGTLAYTSDFKAKHDSEGRRESVGVSGLVWPRTSGCANPSVGVEGGN